MSLISIYVLTKKHKWKCWKLMGMQWLFYIYFWEINYFQCNFSLKINFSLSIFLITYGSIGELSFMKDSLRRFIYFWPISCTNYLPTHFPNLCMCQVCHIHILSAHFLMKLLLFIKKCEFVY